MEKTYHPQAIEQHWYQTWENKGYFAPKTDASVDPFCIMIPPPNVTGSLHMGHAFQDTIMDALTRYHRMQGKDTLWQAGSDHAGIATQMVVERLLSAEGQTRHDLGRDAFIDKIWEWKETSGNTIAQQLRRMGCSLDWENERFTMDEGLSKSVQTVFIQLYEEGLIYRGKRLVNWDPHLHTAVSDLEVESEEEMGSMWYMRYPLSNGSGHLLVATTRPETLLGDCAVAIHPDDERYKHLLGETVELPLCQRRIPIIADPEHVDPEFGTGCVKITPAHDFNDYQVWKRHRDEIKISEQHNGGLINIFTKEAQICQSDLIPDAYIGLDRFDARKQIVEDLKAHNLIEKIEPHKLKVPRGDRSGVVIEPLLTDQWYVKVDSLAKPAIDAVKNGDVRFIPDNWKNTYYEWMNHIEDWCISRQIWWGHRIPAWYDEKGDVYVGESADKIRQQHHLSADYPLTQDEDVLDTWFSSALWPFSTLGWPEENPRLTQFYPNSVLVTGFDIIFFWVARMIMMGLKFKGEVPFKTIYVHGLVRDSQGDKMSKSKGNVIDPIDLIDGIDLESLVKKRTSGMMQPQKAAKIEKQTRKEFPDGINAYGTDAIRFTFAALASNGRDIKFDLSRVEGYRNFCNKIWNATRFVLMHTEGKECQLNGLTLSAADQWILSRLQNTIQIATKSIESYRLDNMARALYEFIWDEYCDWYLELCKPALNGENAETQQATRYTLVTVLETVLRLIHPIMPFISEEIWQKIAPLAGIQGETIMLQPWPTVEENHLQPQAEKEMEWVKSVVLGIRQIRGESNIAPGKPLAILLKKASTTDQQYANTNQEMLMWLARLESIQFLKETDNPPESATALVGEMQILIPLAGLINKAEELARLKKTLVKRETEKARLNGKLSNPKFVDKAPEMVVNKEREKLAAVEIELSTLQAQITKIENI